MAEAITRFFAPIVYQINMALASLSLLAMLFGMLPVVGDYFSPIFNSIAYSGLLIYWRYWYLFALPAYYLGMITDAPRGRQLRTAVVTIAILVFKFVLGYGLPL